MPLNEAPDHPPAPHAPPSRPKVVRAATVLVLVVLVAAAAVGATAAYYALRPASGAGGPGTTTVVDDLGRSVTAPLDAAKIVVLAPSVMDLVYRLGLRSHVVAVGCTAATQGGIFNEYSPNQTALWGLSNSTCIADFPSLATEVIANDSPDLVLATTITPESAVTVLTSTYHLPVVLLAPATMDGIIGDVRLVAQLFPSVAPTATTLEAELSATLARATAEDANLTAEQAPVPSVLLTFYFDTGGYYTFGPGTFGASIIDLAGGANIAASTPLAYGEINATVVLNDQPQVILFGTSWNDAYLVAGETPGVWTTAPYWSQLQGSKIALDVSVVSEPGPSMILALPYLQHDLYPTLVPAP